MVCSNSASQRLRGRITAAAAEGDTVTLPRRRPSADGSSYAASRPFIPNRLDTEVIAAPLAVIHHSAPTPDGQPSPPSPVVLARHDMHLPKEEGAHQNAECFTDSDEASAIASSTYPLNTKTGSRPHNMTVRVKSNTMIATRLARTARPEARPTPTGPPVVKYP